MRVVALVFAVSFATQDVASPIGRVVQLIEGLKAKIEADGATEQATYDKFACWCEETTARKAAAIEEAKLRIDELSKSILNLNGNIGSAGAEIAKLQKDIASTEESISKMTEQRKSENESHLKEKAALEQGIDNMKEAIKVLFAGTSGFSPSMVETRMLTVAAGVRSAMKLYSQNNEKEDMSSVKSFLANPAAFVSMKTPAHLTKYNTQSTVIQGMLDQMLEDFETRLTESVAEEKQKQEDHDKLMSTKREDLSLLQNTLVAREVQHSNDQQQLAEESQERREKKKQLAADEAFFETTKDNCKTKAGEWSERSRLRTEELHGISQAIQILSSGMDTFEASDSTFLQVSAAGPKRTEAYTILKNIATKTNSLRLAAVASTVYTSGHFDSVIADIDNMIANLRKEERADVEHKDWCEKEKKNAESKNENLEYARDELVKKAKRAEKKKKELEGEQKAARDDMAELEEAMKTALTNRNTEHAEFQQALKDDSDAVMLISQAVEAMSAFYTNNKLDLVQRQHAIVRKAPEYTEDPDTAPETFSSPYGGRKSENTGVTAILEMIKEDIQKEIKVARQEEADSVAAYTKLRSENNAAMDALKELDTSLGQQIADKMKLISDTNGQADDTQNSKDATDGFLNDLAPNCEWVDTNFDSRRQARKTEMSGLENAKNVLAGASQELNAGAPAGRGVGFTATASKVSVQAQSVQDELSALDATERSFGVNFLQRK